MKPSNSKIPTQQLPADAAKASPLPPPKAKSELFQLKRDVTGIRIPDGNLENLPKGAAAYLTQALGSSFTIAINHQLYRIDGEDADAIHQAVKPSIEPGLLTQPVTEATIKSILKTCYDPEIPVNLLDLGLIYTIEVIEDSEVKEDPEQTAGAPAYAIIIEMTLTNPGCGMGEVLIQDIKRKLSKLNNVDKIDIQLTFSPPWSREMISTAGQLALGLL